MEIKLDKEELYKAVSKVQSILEKRSNMPILSMIFVSASGSDISLSATDLEISLQQKIPAQVLESGHVTIPGRKLFEILKESKNPTIHIREKENNWIFLSDEQARFNLASLSADEYPTFVEPEGVDMLEMDGSEIADDANFVFDLGADSMQSLELVAGFEEEFDVELDEDKALEVQNLEDAVDFIAGYL